MAIELCRSFEKSTPVKPRHHERHIHGGRCSKWVLLPAAYFFIIRLLGYKTPRPLKHSPTTWPNLRFSTMAKLGPVGRRRPSQRTLLFHKTANLPISRKGKFALASAQLLGICDFPQAEAASRELREQREFYPLDVVLKVWNRTCCRLCQRLEVGACRLWWESFSSEACHPSIDSPPREALTPNTRRRGRPP